MKNTTYLFITCTVLIAFSCKKSANTEYSGLYGTWKINAYYFSAGGPGAWTNAKATDKSYVQFDQSGTAESNIYNVLKFTVIDSATLTMTGTTPAENYRYTLKHDTLTLSPSGPIVCTEGCANRFIR